MQPGHILSLVARGMVSARLMWAILLTGTAIPALGNNHDHALIKALAQATRDSSSQNTDLDALLWLSSMSERLERRIEDPFYRVRLLEAIHTEAELAGLDPQLVLAVIEVESNFDRYALSSAGAEGLMQVMPFWKDVYQRPEDDLYNPLTSLRYGCRILRHYLDKHTNPLDALAAYNGSLGRYTYPDKVMAALERRWQFEADGFSPQDATGDSDTKVALR